MTEKMAVNAIRILSADAVQKAKSGHPGLPLGAAPIAYELWAQRPIYSFGRTWIINVVFTAASLRIWSDY